MEMQNWHKWYRSKGNNFAFCLFSELIWRNNRFFFLIFIFKYQMDELYEFVTLNCLLQQKYQYKDRNDFCLICLLIIAINYGRCVNLKWLNRCQTIKTPKIIGWFLFIVMATSSLFHSIAKLLNFYLKISMYILYYNIIY